MHRMKMGFLLLSNRKSILELEEEFHAFVLYLTEFQTTYVRGDLT